jgi:translation initiation factor IF-2
MVQIAGIEVISENLHKNMRYRLTRKNEVIKLGLKLNSMKQNKVDINVIYEGDECGLIFEEFDEFQIGDILECYSVDSTKEGITNTKGSISCF